MNSDSDSTESNDLSHLYNAIDRRNITIIKELCEQDRDLMYDAIEDVIETQDQNFIVDFMRETDQMDSSALLSLYGKGTKATIEYVIKKVKFSQEDLVDAGTAAELSCSNENYIDLLERIIKPEDQEDSIEACIWRLFENDEIDQLDSLLPMLESKTFKSENIFKLAVQKVFNEASFTGNKIWVERLYDHPAITPGVYANQLIDSGERDPKYSDFQWLLGKADRDDLLAVQRKKDFGKKTVHFRNAINQAMSTAKNGGARFSNANSDDSTTKETIDKLTDTVPTDPQSNNDTDPPEIKRRKGTKN